MWVSKSLQKPTDALLGWHLAAVTAVPWAAWKVALTADCWARQKAARTDLSWVQTAEHCLVDWKVSPLAELTADWKVVYWDVETAEWWGRCSDQLWAGRRVVKWAARRADHWVD